MSAQRTTWFVTPQLTVAGTDYLGNTPPEALNSMGGLLVRIADVLHRQQAKEGLVLVDEQAAAKLGLTEPATDDGTRQRALDAASAAGFRSGKLGTFTTFFANQRPTIHVGRVEVLAATAEASDPETWPWGPVWHPDITTGLQHWHRLTGVAWQALPAVMGLEVMRQTLAPYRIGGGKGQRRPDLVDDATSTIHPGEAMWSPEMWSRRELAPYAHGYDKRRAGLTAAGVAKLSPAKLIRRRVEFAPTWAGWWHVTVSPWGLSHQMPHPMGPGATARHQKSMWVTTPTMELCAQLAELGVLSMPEVIDALVGPARTVLAPWQERLEAAYQAPPGDDYPEVCQGRVQDAVKVSAVRGLGMLNKSDGRSSILRGDWYYGVNATKRANMWRNGWRIGQTEKRWPVAIEDDCMWYASDDPDPVRAAPALFRRNGTDPQLLLDTPGGYRIQETVEHNG